MDNDPTFRFDMPGAEEGCVVVSKITHLVKDHDSNTCRIYVVGGAFIVTNEQLNVLEARLNIRLREANAG